MSFEIGDTVHTTSGKLYVVRTLYTGMNGEPMAGLAPPMPKPGRRRTAAMVSSLTLIRSRELSLAFHYAADSEREATPEWMRERAIRQAADWLNRAEHRNDDSRAALHLGSDRILDLEVAAS